MASQITSDLADALQAADLDGAYWADIFKKRLGITKPSQVQYLSVSDLDSLTDARWEWEKRALRTFLETVQHSQKTAQVGVLSHRDKYVCQSGKDDGSVEETKKAEVQTVDDIDVSDGTLFPGIRSLPESNLDNTVVDSPQKENPVDQDQESLSSASDKNKVEIPSKQGPKQSEPFNEEHESVVAGKQHTKLSEIVDVDDDKGKVHLLVPIQDKDQPVTSGGQNNEQSVGCNELDTNLQPGPCAKDEAGDETILENIHKLAGKQGKTKQDKESVLTTEEQGTFVPQVRMQAYVKETSQTGPKDYMGTLEKLGLSYHKILEKLDIDLIEMLHRSGLEEAYWTRVFDTKLGISTTSQLQALCLQGPRQGSMVEVLFNAARTDDEKGAMELFLQQVKISIWDVMRLENRIKIKDAEDLPWKMLQKLLMMNYRARDNLVSDMNELTAPKCTGDLFNCNESEDEDEISRLNPMDVLLLTYTCCDRFLQQLLCQKLFECQMAIPLIYPHRSPGNLVMSLWALRTIVVEWRDKDTNKVVEASVTDTTVPTVAFTRLGTPALSKAKLINDILRDEVHDTFFHRDCPGGTAKRKAAEGLVECSWFLPSGKESDPFSKAVMFLNLRGDGLLYPKQMNVLTTISSTVVVVANAEHLEEPQHLQAFAQVCKGARNVILLATSKPSKQLEPALKDAVGEEAMRRTEVLSGFRKSGLKNASDLKGEMRKVLSATQGLDGMTVEKQALLAEKAGILVDEHDSECCLGKELALKVVKQLEGKAVTECKRHLLPLQGELWQKYSELLKMRHRSGGRSSASLSPNETDEIGQKMKRLRNEQAHICSNLSPFMADFCNFLTFCYGKPGSLSSSFLQWMQILLDKNCRLHLPGLRTEYNKTWVQFQKAKAKQDKTSLKSLQEDVDRMEQQLVQASLGLEHLFRELGQMYEAITESKVKTDVATTQLVNSFPKLAAKLLLQGQPLELLDGDASNVPITWIKAVLAKLAKILGKKKLFVLSVLGVQSSGKSTLLNTMFGLRFAVSAGRCTRGAFMQLVPLKKESQQAYDYIVVVDTEGLRAPELGKQKFHYDNALATLVIGLGDTTIINIKGENTAEISDVLQIVVHAFLRMKMVNKHLNTNQTCVFIHQNVPAINAREKMLHGCQKLQENLDFMTREAAQGENMNYNSFSQIIKFDVHKHVWYFSDLWHGSPPMAPANPDYSLCTEAVKTTLLDKLIKAQTIRLTAADLSLRVKDLWNGILSEDFVFSFRNSLEVKAYNAMQTRYNHLEWEFQKSIIAWIQNHAEAEIKKCGSAGDLPTCYNTQVSNLSAEIAKEQERNACNLDTYFKTCEWRDIVIQWKEAKKNALSAAADRTRLEGEKYLCQLCDEHEKTLVHKKSLSDRKARIMAKAVELGDELRGRQAKESELKDRFNSMWTVLIAELVSDDRPDHLPTIASTLKRNLRHLFSNSGPVLSKELEHNPLKQPFPHDTLEGSMTLQDICKDHFSFKQTFYQAAKHFGSKILPIGDPQKKARHETLSITNGIYHQIDVYLNDLRSRDVRFFETQGLEVLHILLKGIDEHNSSQERPFSILPTYSVKLAVNICRYSIPAFCRVAQIYEERHGMRAKLEADKVTAWHLFNNKLKECTEELIVADLFCDQLADDVEKAVGRKIENRVADEVIKGRFNISKWHLMIAVMEDLAKKDDFKSFTSYIRHGRTYCFEWITDYVNRMLFNDHKYKEWSEDYLGNLISCIDETVQHASTEAAKDKAKPHSLKQWIDTFCKTLQNKKTGIIVTDKSFVHLAGRNAADFDHLQEVICKKLQTMKKTLTNQFQQQTDSSVKWAGCSPYKRIMDKLWGCSAQCPFCREPCLDTSVDHYPGACHRCIQHRPQGVRGIHWYGTTDFVPDTCNYAVQSGAEYQCGVGNYACRKYGGCKTTGDKWIWHPFREYKTNLKEWDIAPSATNNVSKYWMWFSATYRTQLEEYHSIDVDIPQTWNDVSKAEALNSLRDY